MRILFALSGLHRLDRGAEIAFTSVASGLALRDHAVTLIGSGPQRPGVPYRYLQAPVLPRERFERFPKLPAFRNETSWEELSFVPGFLKAYRPDDFDVTLTCSYPFLNWALRTRRRGGRRPAHLFVTQNGDWPARAGNSEYRFFGCDGLICINPDYLEANQHRCRAALIPNGVDRGRFTPGPATRAAFGLPETVPIVLMVSALIASKNVGTGIEAVSRFPDAHLVVAGDGPLREEIRAKAQALMPGRYHNLTVKPEQMPDLYRSADLFLHLSRDESFGNVFVEAMACGRPIVAWDLPRTRWITGDTCRLARDQDLNDLSDAIASGLKESGDSGALVRRAERFSWSNIATEYETFLGELLADTTRGQERG